MSDVIPKGAFHYPLSVSSFTPEKNAITTSDNSTITYDYLVVAPGLKCNWGAVKGLSEALADPNAKVSSVYSIDSVEKAWQNMIDFKSGNAVFTQPAGGIKCAGAPQKVLYMADSTWRRTGVRGNANVTFATGMPSMFAVAKYNAALDKIRQQKEIEALFQHNLTGVDKSTRVATFAKADGTTTEKEFDLLHVVPPQGPLDFIKNSPIADAAGWVSVNPETTRHTKFANIFSIGDASSLPNSKTAAAVTSQAPVLVDNLRASMEGKPLPSAYDGYASCPLLVGHNELMLAEFKYGGVPKETFAEYVGSQDKPRNVFYQLKKHFFPYVYFNSWVNGTWFGPSGWSRPTPPAPSSP